MWDPRISNFSSRTGLENLHSVEAGLQCLHEMRSDSRNSTAAKASRKVIPVHEYLDNILDF
jgi:hypothetical protein